MILMSKRILAAACAAATALALSACSPSASTGGKTSKDGTLTVMASFYPLKYLAEKVGGEHVTVTSLTPDGAEPHDLELSPKMVDSLASADAVVYLAGFQGAVDEAVEQHAPKTVIDVSPAASWLRSTRRPTIRARTRVPTRPSPAKPSLGRPPTTTMKATSTRATTMSTPTTTTTTT